MRQLLPSRRTSREVDTSQKTETQNKNWMEWKDVLDVKKELEKKKYLDYGNDPFFYIKLTKQFYNEWTSVTQEESKKEL